MENKTPIYKLKDDLYILSISFIFFLICILTSVQFFLFFDNLEFWGIKKIRKIAKNLSCQCALNWLNFFFFNDNFISFKKHFFFVNLICLCFS